MEERRTAGARVSGIRQRDRDLVVCHRGSCDHVSSDSTMHAAEYDALWTTTPHSQIKPARKGKICIISTPVLLVH